MVLCIGLFILIACSYSTLHESAKPKEPVFKLPADVLPFSPNLPKIEEKIPVPKIEINIPMKPTDNRVLPNIPKLEPKLEPKDKIPLNAKNDAKESEKRQEPPIPQEPDEPQPAVILEEKVKPKEIAPPILEEKNKDVENYSKSVDKNLVVSPHNTVLNDIHPDALKKEDKELKNGRVSQSGSEQLEKKAEKKAIEAERKAVAAEKKAEEASLKQDELLRKIEAQQVEQKKLLEEQRKLLLELKEHKESHRIEDEKKLAEPIVNEEKSQLANAKPPSNQNLPQERSNSDPQLNNVNIMKPREVNADNLDQVQNNQNFGKNVPHHSDTNNNFKAESNISKEETKITVQKSPDIPLKPIDFEPKPVHNLKNEISPNKILKETVPIKNVIPNSPKNYVVNQPDKPNVVGQNLDKQVVNVPALNTNNNNINAQNKNTKQKENINNEANHNKEDGSSKTKLKETNNEAIHKKEDRSSKTKLNIPVAKRLSDSFQNSKLPHESKVSKRSVSVDPNDVVFNISKPDVSAINPPKMSFTVMKNEIRKLLSYQERRRKNKK